MAYYDYYHNAPGWGTQQYQFVTPPMPSYQPQPTWGGQDYYRAHAGLADNSMYDYAWNKVRNFSGAGIGQEEASIYHRRAYGGVGDLHRMNPSEVGAAAAYEAWRNWKTHYSVYGQPISGDRERQREALIGLAVGEATRLWQYTGRADSYGRLEAGEAAAASASIMLSQSSMYDSYGDDMDPYGDYRGRLSRRNSVASLHAMSRGRSMSRPRTLYDGYAGGGLGGGLGGSMYDSASVYGGPDAYDGYGAGGYPASAYPGTGRMRARSFSSLGTPGVVATTPMSVPTVMTPSVSYASSAVSPSYGYPANYGTPYTQYATPGTVATVYSSPSRRRSHSHSRHHRHGRHRHRHGSSGSYYVATAAPSYGY